MKVKIASAQYPIDFVKSIEEWRLKIKTWVSAAASNGAEFLLFPEYGSLEISSLLSEDRRKYLYTQSFELRIFIEEFVSTFKQLALEYKVFILAPSFPVFHDGKKSTNRVYVFTPNGQVEFQDKVFLTRFEDEECKIQPGAPEIKIFKTTQMSFSISICFDVEFSFIGLMGAHGGAHVLFVPSCTETIKGMNRVHIGARARALENQMYTVVSQTVGSADWSQAVDENNGTAAFYSTPDVGMPDDGILVKGELNKPCWVYEELSISALDRIRKSGAVFNFNLHQPFIRNLNSAFSIKSVQLN